MRWIADEANAELSATLLGRDDLVAPDLLAVEVGSALRRKASMGELTRDQVADGFALIFRSIQFHSSSPELMARAFDLSAAPAHPIYDCVYVALAEALNGQFVTNDLELAKRIRRGGFGSLLLDLLPP